MLRTVYSQRVLQIKEKPTSNKDTSIGIRFPNWKEAEVGVSTAIAGEALRVNQVKIVVAAAFGTRSKETAAVRALKRSVTP